jgi:hypothetical protein
MRNYINFDNKRWELVKNGSKGIMLVRNSPTRMIPIDCNPNETVSELHDKYLNMFREAA